MRALVLVGVLLLAGCAQPQPAPGQDLDTELGVGPTLSESEPSPAASPLPATPSPTPPAAVANTTPTASASGAAGGGTSPEVSPSPSPAPVAVEQPEPSPTAEGEGQVAPVVLMAVADRGGDHGARGPEWADLRSVELVEIGNDLRVTLRFEGQLPATPPAGEVPLIGVDIGDDGYQLFVEGGDQSWAAYLDTPEGFVAYPGSFSIAGRAIVFQVPFSAVGSPTRAPVRVFAEWSRDSGTLGVLNPSSEDTLDGEPHTFDRTS